MSREAPKGTAPQRDLRRRERDLMRELEESGGIRMTHPDRSTVAEDPAGQTATEGEPRGTRKQGGDPPLRVGGER